MAKTIQDLKEKIALLEQDSAKQIILIQALHSKIEKQEKDFAKVSDQLKQNIEVMTKMKATSPVAIEALTEQLKKKTAECENFRKKNDEFIKEMKFRNARLKQEEKYRQEQTDKQIAYMNNVDNENRASLSAHINKSLGYLQDLYNEFREGIIKHPKFLPDLMVQFRKKPWLCFGVNRT